MADKNSDISADALDDLLNFDDVVETAASEPVAEAIVEEVPAVEEVSEADAAADARIKELEARLSNPLTNPSDETGRPLPEQALTPKQKQIRDLEDKLAKRSAKELEMKPETLEAADGSGAILIHFLEDGFTAQGRVWYKGQEVEFAPNGRAFSQTRDRFGNSWLDFSDNEQIDRYGKVFFRRGPWPGKGYEDQKSAAEERKRNRAAPVVAL